MATHDHINIFFLNKKITNPTLELNAQRTSFLKTNVHNPYLACNQNNLITVYITILKCSSCTSCTLNIVSHHPSLVLVSLYPPHIESYN